MRRVTASLVTRAVACRGVYSIWGTVVHEHNELQPQSDLPMSVRLTTQLGLRGFQFETTPVKNYGKEFGTLTEPEEYLLSAIDDDIERILNVDWTFEFDAFWSDRVQSHEGMFKNLFDNESRHLAKWIFGNASKNEKAKKYAQARLSYLQSALKWAQETEKVYSSIVNARFHMQREVFDAFEREKILAGCVAAVEDLQERVPSEFKRKAVLDAEQHLNNMRHWVWDAPNAKQVYKRRLA